MRSCCSNHFREEEKSGRSFPFSSLSCGPPTGTFRQPQAESTAYFCAFALVCGDNMGAGLRKGAVREVANGSQGMEA
eukprot:COSAG06_NODE_1476_length_9335_cov_181.006063_8_plen_77_part_00